MGGVPVGPRLAYSRIRDGRSSCAQERGSNTGLADARMESGHAGDHLPGSGNPNSPTTTPNQPTTRARSRSQLAAIVARNHQLELEREAAQAAAEVDSGDLHQDERKDSGEITAGELRAEVRIGAR